jgi:hypothetical protein
VAKQQACDSTAQSKTNADHHMCNKHQHPPNINIASIVCTRCWESRHCF